MKRGNYFQKMIQNTSVAAGLPKGLYHQVIEHDDWCLGLATNYMPNCNCDPDIQIYDEASYQEYLKKKSGK